MQSISCYIGTCGEIQKKANQENYVSLDEQAVIYDRYDIETTASLLYYYLQKERYQEVIVLGEYIIENSSLENIMKSNNRGQILIKDNLKAILLYLIKSYSLINNKEKFNQIEAILKRYHSKDAYVNAYIDSYAKYRLKFI